MLGFEPATPVRRRCITNVCYRRTAKLRRRRHAPAHLNQVAAFTRIADDGCFVIREDARHAWQVACAILRYAEKTPDSVLVLGYAVEIADVDGPPLVRMVADF